MSDVFEFHRGTLPLLVSVPHDGRLLPADIASRMTPRGRAIPDTDWHVARLYDFARELGASLLVANYSRYVVDLNRSRSDESLYPGQLATGLCPGQTFAGEAIYADGEGVSGDERLQRTERYWQPYHDRIEQSLAALRDEHGRALLWDAHSIPSEVPRLFDGELPQLNIGSWDGRSCYPRLQDAVAQVAGQSGYSVVENGRFRGGYITRHYGDPRAGIHALQLEIAQRCYMSESTQNYDESLAGGLQKILKGMLEAFTIQP
jgi:N-formylglutamate amidohydrolase